MQIKIQKLSGSANRFTIKCNGSTVAQYDEDHESIHIYFKKEAIEESYQMPMHQFIQAICDEITDFFYGDLSLDEAIVVSYKVDYINSLYDEENDPLCDMMTDYDICCSRTKNF